MYKVALAGAQDTGKTTVARMLSGRLASRGIFTHYVQEFARDYIPKAGSIDSLAEELLLIEQQTKREREAPVSTAVMVTDSPVFLAYVYSTMMVDTRRLTKKDIIMLGRVYDKVLDHGGYDLVLMLPVVWQPADDGVRPEELRRKNGVIDLRIESFIHLHGVEVQNLTTTHHDRHEVLNDYTNLAEEIVMSFLEEHK